MIKSGKQYLYNASWICQNGWPWATPTCTFDPLTHWESEELQCLNLSCLWHLVLNSITNFPSHVFFGHKSFWLMGEKQKKLSQLLLITQCCSFLFSFISVSNAWEMKKKNIYCSKINPLVDRGCGCLSEFPSFPYPKVQSVNKKIIWSCFAIIKDKSVDSLCPGLLNKPTDY